MGRQPRRIVNVLVIAVLVAVTVGAGHLAQQQLPPESEAVEIQATSKAGAFFFTLSPAASFDGKPVRAASLCVVRHQDPYFSAANVEFLANASTNRLGVGAGGVVIKVEPAAGKTWGEVKAEGDVVVSGLEDLLRIPAATTK